jgi:hypothetical protein
MPGDEFGLERIFGRNRLAVSVPDGWIVEAVVLADGTDVYDTPYAFEPGKHYSDVRVVLSDRTATLKGRVAGAPTPLPAPGMMVVAVPEDETAGPSRPHRVPSGSVQDDQSFLIPDLRPGRTYLVAAYAWPASAEGDAWYVQHARSATRIHVTGPGVHTVDVRPAR